MIATHAGPGEEIIEQEWDDRRETVLITYYEADELVALAAGCGLVATMVQERPPLDHEHQVQKLYLTAAAT